MRKRLFFAWGMVIIVSFFMVSCMKHLPQNNCSQDDLIASVSVFASGLNNPRGLAFGPEGSLYVAEGGVGGTDSTTGICDQIPPPLGPYKGSPTGARIVKVNNAGKIITVADNIPSSVTAMGEVSGVGDIAFVGRDLYGVLAGAGCTHGVSSVPNGIIKVNPNKSWDVVVNLSEYQMSHPVANPPLDFEPDGTWYSLITVGNDLYAVEPNHGELVKISPQGQVTRIVDFSAAIGHIVPTAIVWHDGNFYVGNLNVFPITGNSSVYKVTPSGDVSVVATGFSTILGIDFDNAGAMYVLENTTGNPFPTPGTGDVIRINSAGERRAIVTGLNFPTALAFSSDNKLYISNTGFGPDAVGGGEILKVSFSCPNDESAKKY